MSRVGMFVLSSTHDRLPTILSGAVACGYPVVWTDDAGTVEMLDYGTWVRPAGVGDPASLARSRRASQDPPMPDLRQPAVACFQSRPAVPIGRQG
jgi:hypothetical protein